MRRLLGGMAVVCALCATAASQGLDGERFTPAISAEGGFVNEHPAVPLHLGWGLGLFLNFADDQVVERDDAGNELSKPVDTGLSADLVGSLGLFGRLELGLGLPIHIIWDGDPYGNYNATSGLGDLRFLPKFAIIRAGTLERHFMLSLGVPITFPTGNDLALRGAPGFTITPLLMLAAHFGHFGLGLDVGYRWRQDHPDQPWGDSIPLGPWVSIPFGDALSLRIEMFAEKHVNTRVAGADFPIEVLGGLEYKVSNDLLLYGGASFGLTDGIGDPDFRIIGGIRFRHNHPADQGYGDRDRDGVMDKDDKAPDDPEDEDGFEDDDGKPEPDNDEDGIPDEDDECPDIKGDREHRGCPAKTYVKIENGKIFIFGKVQFRTGSADIEHRSEPLLDQIAQALNSNPDVHRVRVEGHTDNVGDPRLNQRLSEERAASVKSALEKRGVDGDRLEGHGYGETKPIAPNKSPGGRQKNRRVEFVIVR